MPNKTTSVAWRSAQDRRAISKKHLVGDIELPAYDAEMVLKICDRIQGGELLNVICSPTSGNVTTQTFWRWTVIFPECARAYAAAREISAYAMEEEALQIGRGVWGEPGSAQRVRAADIYMNQLRWSASRRNPRIYSEKTAVKVVVPIQINTGLDLLGDGSGEKTLDGADVYNLTAQVVEEGERVQDPTSAMIGDEGTPPLKKMQVRRRVLRGKKDEE